jgi:hypothetical protein
VKECIVKPSCGEEEEKEKKLAELAFGASLALRTLLVSQALRG